MSLFQIVHVGPVPLSTKDLDEMADDFERLASDHCGTVQGDYYETINQVFRQHSAKIRENSSGKTLAKDQGV